MRCELIRRIFQAKSLLQKDSYSLSVIANWFLVSVFMHKALKPVKRPGGFVEGVKTVETLRSLKRPDGLVEDVKTGETA
jgi:hypothetical protein